MRSAIIKKTSQGEQENQTTITTKNNYLQILMSIYLINKLISEVKIASDKTKTKQCNFYFPRKDMGSLHNKAR